MTFFSNDEPQPQRFLTLMPSVSFYGEEEFLKLAHPISNIDIEELSGRDLTRKSVIVFYKKNNFLDRNKRKILVDKNIANISINNNT